MKFFKRLIYFFVLLSFCVMGCAQKTAAIKDLQVLNQDAMHYVKDGANDRIIDKTYVECRFNEKFFFPWKQTEPYTQKEQISKTISKFYNREYYAENKKLLKKERLNKIIDNIDIENYYNAGYPAITIKNTDMRVLPTNKPFFLDFTKPGEGYPFDYMQNSFLLTNTPIFVVHISKNKDWMFIETPFCSGWIEANTVKKVDNDFMIDWIGETYVAITKDDVPIYNDKNEYLFAGYIGMLFPKIAETKDSYVVKIANHEIEKATVSKNISNIKPLEFTEANIANVANEFIGQLYGWGGLYENRDCSAMLKDLFVPFSIWLPRNSSDQANHGGKFIECDDLKGKKKEEFVIENAVPFKTLLYKRGHIMLYLGQEDDKIVALHNLWGLRTRSMFNKNGRYVVGEAIISTLSPGVEMANVKKKDSLFTKLQGITLLDAASLISSQENNEEYKLALEFAKDLERDKEGLCILVKGIDKKLYLIKDNKVLFDIDVAIGMSCLYKEREGDKKTPIGDYKIKWMTSKKGPAKQNPGNISSLMVHGKTYSVLDTELYIGDIKDLRVKTLPNGDRIVSKNPNDAKPTELEMKLALDEKLWVDSYGGENAYVIALNYPNEKDRREGKTGTSIMVHASLKFERQGKSYKGTYGCVAMAVRDAKKLYKYVNPETSVRIIE